jgi:hypothetical protein
MNQVNHPKTHTVAPGAISGKTNGNAQQQAAAESQTTTAVLDNSSGIVPEGQAELMQQASAATDKPEVTQPPQTELTVQVVEKPAAVVNTPHASMHSLNANIMFTLNLTDSRMHGLKAQLSRVNLDGQELNLYSPFRKAGKKTETNPAAEGIVRSVLNAALDITDSINNSRLMYLGKSSEVLATFRNSLDTLRASVANALPDENTVVTTLIDEESEQEIPLLLKDIISVRSWLHSPSAGPDSAPEAIGSHNAVLNFTVAPGMLYDAEEPVKYIGQVENILKLVTEKRGEEGSTNMLLAVVMDAASVADAATRDLIGQLIEEEGFVLYTRNELHGLDISDWLPQSKTSVDRDLLVPNGDLLFVRLLGEEDEAEDGDDAGAGAAE